LRTLTRRLAASLGRCLLEQFRLTLQMHYHQGALKAFQNAFKARAAPQAENKELLLEVARLHAVEEDFPAAVAAYERVGSDAAREEISALRRYIKQAHRLVEEKGQLKPKKLEAIVKELQLPDGTVADREVASIASLADGANQGKVVCLFVVAALNRPHTDSPFWNLPRALLVVDNAGVFAVLSVHNVAGPEEQVDAALRPLVPGLVLDPWFARPVLDGLSFPLITVRDPHALFLSFTAFREHLVARFID
jgi:hypothetical protein